MSATNLPKSPFTWVVVYLLVANTCIRHLVTLEIHYVIFGMTVASYLLPGFPRDAVSEPRKNQGSVPGTIGLLLRRVKGL
jgi:hypothetical protein